MIPRNNTYFSKPIPPHTMIVLDRHFHHYFNNLYLSLRFISPAHPQDIFSNIITIIHEDSMRHPRQEERTKYTQTTPTNAQPPLYKKKIKKSNTNSNEQTNRATQIHLSPESSPSFRRVDRMFTYGSIP